LIVVATRHTAAATDDLHMFARVTALLTLTMAVLMAGHVAEISVWASFYTWAGVETDKASPFELAFENYTALGYGDAVPDHGTQRAAPDRLVSRDYFEVMRMAELQITRRPPRSHSSRPD
jgi:hypothetical protein